MYDALSLYLINDHADARAVVDRQCQLTYDIGTSLELLLAVYLPSTVLSSTEYLGIYYRLPGSGLATASLL
jgi:hypothetical protein